MSSRLYGYGDSIFLQKIKTQVDSVQLTFLLAQKTRFELVLPVKVLLP